MLLMAVAPAFARSRHRASLDSQEMRITNSPTSEPIVAPPVTVPESSVYDTPNPRVAVALPPIPLAGSIQSLAEYPPERTRAPPGLRPSPSNQRISSP